MLCQKISNQKIPFYEECPTRVSNSFSILVLFHCAFILISIKDEPTFYDSQSDFTRNQSHCRRVVFSLSFSLFVCVYFWKCTPFIPEYFFLLSKGNERKSDEKLENKKGTKNIKRHEADAEKKRACNYNNNRNVYLSVCQISRLFFCWSVDILYSKQKRTQHAQYEIKTGLRRKRIKDKDNKKRIRTGEPSKRNGKRQNEIEDCWPYCCIAVDTAIQARCSILIKRTICITCTLFGVHCSKSRTR